MGLAKHLPSDRQSFTAQDMGTIGWQAPELIPTTATPPSSSSPPSSGSASGSGSPLTATAPSYPRNPPSDTDPSPNSNRRATKKVRFFRITWAYSPENLTLFLSAFLATFSSPTHTSSQVDVFSFGCVAHFVLTGLHPFGEHYERQVRALAAQADLAGLAQIDPLAADLVQKCIERDPAFRSGLPLPLPLLSLPHSLLFHSLSQFSLPPCRPLGFSEVEPHSPSFSDLFVFPRLFSHFYQLISDDQC